RQVCEEWRDVPKSIRKLKLPNFLSSRRTSPVVFDRTRDKSNALRCRRERCSSSSALTSPQDGAEENSASNAGDRPRGLCAPTTASHPWSPKASRRRESAFENRLIGRGRPWRTRSGRRRMPIRGRLQKV